MTILKVLIVDDEQPAREEIKFLLSDNKNVDIVADVDNLQDALSVINDNKIDLIFLDIQINNQNGMTLAEKINGKEIGVVFATAYDEYAVEAFSLNAIDYLLKPFSKQRVDQSIQKTLNKLAIKPKKKSSFRKLTFWNDDKMIIVSPDEIIYLTVDDRKVVIVTAKGKLTDAGPLQNTLDKLDSTMFIRTHRSFVVNIEKIEEIIPWFNNTFILKMVGLKETEIPVSRSYLQDFKKQIGLL